MSVMWRTKVSVLNTKRKNVSVVLELVDNTDLENIKILEKYSVMDALINTPEQKQQIFTELERQYYAQKQKEKDDVAVIGTLASDINEVAKTWEIK